MFPHGLTSAGHVAARRASDSIKTVEIAWTRVHAIIKSTTCAKEGVSEMIERLTWRQVATRRASDCHQREIAWSRSDGLRWSRVERSGASDLHQVTIVISDGPEDSWKNSATAARSSRDRGAIEPQSHVSRWGVVSRRSACDRRRFRTTIVARSRPDRGAIVAWSWRKLRRCGSKIEALVITNPSRHWSHDPCSRNRTHEAATDAPRSPPSSTISSLISSLKSHVLPLWTSTFDRLVKKLSEFRGRSLVHRVSPAFRLDCEAIRAGLITNFSLISSNFPLEFRTSTRKNPSKFASIHENWSPILAEIGLVVRFDRLSWGNLSFY